MGTDSALMFRQSLRQNEIDILANLSLSGFRNGQLHTGADGYARDYLPVMLIQKTGFLMISLTRASTSSFGKTSPEKVRSSA